MAARKIRELVDESSQKATWRYPRSYSPWALRLIQVAPLLPKTRPRLVLDEFSSVALDLDDSRPKYAAISYIWQPSPAVARFVNTRPI